MNYPVTLACMRAGSDKQTTNKKCYCYSVVTQLLHAAREPQEMLSTITTTIMLQIGPLDSEESFLIPSLIQLRRSAFLS
jgi:hypothetical protein